MRAKPRPAEAEPFKSFARPKWWREWSTAAFLRSYAHGVTPTDEERRWFGTRTPQEYAEEMRKLNDAYRTVYGGLLAEMVQPTISLNSFALAPSGLWVIPKPTR